jgi:hypothetical protein
MKILSLVALLVASFAIHYAINQSNMKEIENKRNEILNDQLYDMIDQIASLRAQRTYEEGVRDGIANRRDRAYMEGYHMATQHSQGILPAPTTEITSNEE